MKKKIVVPTTIATQHPDNASKTWWSNTEFISTQQECEECSICFKELGAQEYMWDWEGKFVDEAVVEKLFRKYHDYFKENQLGKDKFLIFRIPNIWEEKNTRVARAFMSILTSEDFAQELKFHGPPIFEVILPMANNAEQLIHIKKSFHKIAKLKHQIFSGAKEQFLHINILPTFEQVEDLINSRQILDKYVQLHEKEYKEKPQYIRPFIARSDPALSAGYISAILAAKIAISSYYEFSKEHNIPVYPMIGTGSLPFRGACNPDNIEDFIKEYPGIRTVTLQSAFRYDYPLDEVKQAIKLLNMTLPILEPKMVSSSDQKKLEEAIKILQKNYQKTVDKIAVDVNEISKHIPARRERILHIGLAGYGRSMGKIKLPRAIKFTGAMYSLGVPPEFIGTGRGLKECKDKGLLPIIKKHYINLIRDLSHAGHYLNKECLQTLAENNAGWKDVQKDVELVEEVLNIKITQNKPHHFIHRNLVSNIVYKRALGQDLQDDIVEAAIIRKSLG